LEERFEPFGIVLEAATDIDAFERLVVAIVSVQPFAPSIG
jgi:hypothetical protein